MLKKEEYLFIEYTRNWERIECIINGAVIDPIYWNQEEIDMCDSLRGDAFRKQWLYVSDIKKLKSVINQLLNLNTEQICYIRIEPNNKLKHWFRRNRDLIDKCIANKVHLTVDCKSELYFDYFYSLNYDKFYYIESYSGYGQCDDAGSILESYVYELESSDKTEEYRKYIKKLIEK